MNRRQYVNQENRVALDGRTVEDMDLQVKRDELIEAMAKLGQRLRPEFDAERFKREAGYVGTLIAN